MSRKDPEARRQYWNEWYHRNKEAYDARYAVRRSANRSRINENQRRYYRKLRTAAFDNYGTECACCGEDREPFLCIDHIGGGGAEHRRQIGVAGSWFYLWLRKNGYPDGFRTLCHNCNMALGCYGECPHEAEYAVSTGNVEIPK